MSALIEPAKHVAANPLFGDYRRFSHPRLHTDRIVYVTSKFLVFWTEVDREAQHRPLK